MGELLHTTPDLEKACSDRTAKLAHETPEDETVSSSASRQTRFLDGVRGLASFLVYLAHNVSWWYGIGNELEQGFGYHGVKHFGQLPFIRILFTGGNASVAIFFVLSGYVLSVSHLRALQEKQRGRFVRLLSATIRRPLRLYIPPLGISFIFAIVLQLPFGLSPQLDWPVAKENLIAELRNWVSESLKMMNPFIKHGVYETWYAYDPPAWTLPVELKGSLLVFLLIGILSPFPLRKSFIIYAAIGLLLLAVYEWSMACFLGGVVLAITDLESLDSAPLKNLSPNMKSVVYHAVFYAGWFLLGEPAGPRDPEFSSGAWGWSLLTELIPSVYYTDEYWRFYNSIGAFMLVYGILRIQWLQHFFSTRTLRYLGQISFSLYLIHIPFEWTIGDRIHRVMGVIRQDFTTIFDNLLPVPDYGPLGLSTGFFIAQAIILPINLYLSKLGTRYLDRVSVKSGKWLVAKLGMEAAR